MSILHEILAFLEERQPQMIAFLRELVLAESPTAVPESQAAVQGLLRGALREEGFAVEFIPGEQTGGHLYARPASADATVSRQLLLGHCDTVWPIGTLAEMPVRIEDGRMAGPGVYDMKAGLTQMIFSLKAIRAVGRQPAITPTVFVNSDEEEGSAESAPHIRRLAAEMERVFVLEPSLGRSGKLKTARKGVGRYTVTVTGTAAHAGLDPEKGRSAILEMSHVIQKLYALNDPGRGITVNVGTVGGGISANVVAPRSSAMVDVRVLTSEDAAEIEHAILNLEPETPGVSLEVSGALNRRPLERTPRNRTLWRLAQDLGREMALELDEGTAGGASDGNITSEFTATLDGLGAVGDGAHAEHEFIYVDAMVERAALLAALLLAPPLNGP